MGRRRARGPKRAVVLGRQAGGADSSTRMAPAAEREDRSCIGVSVGDIVGSGGPPPREGLNGQVDVVLEADSQVPCEHAHRGVHDSVSLILR